MALDATDTIAAKIKAIKETITSRKVLVNIFKATLPLGVSFLGGKIFPPKRKIQQISFNS